MQSDIIRVHCWRCVFNYHARWVSTSISLINLDSPNSILVIAFCSLCTMDFYFSFIYLFANSMCFFFVVSRPSSTNHDQLSLFDHQKKTFKMISIDQNFFLFTHFICSLFCLCSSIYFPDVLNLIFKIVITK